ncbi:MAG: DUF4388 domain-containing protein [Terriglobia bacterium]
MSIIGDLQDIPLADLIQLLANSQRTGILYINTNEGRSAIVFKNGFVVSASKPNLENRLGQLLRKQNDISELDLEICLKEQAQTKRPLGEILLDRLLVTPDQLRAIMRQQVVETVNEIVNQTAGSFSFHSEAHLPSNLVNFDTQHLLLDIAYLQDTYGKGYAARSEDLFSPHHLVGEVEEDSWQQSQKLGETFNYPALRLLRELSMELARPRESTEVSLLVLRLAAEFFDRCIFFVVSQDSFIACGGFGFPFKMERGHIVQPRVVVPIKATSILGIVLEAMQSYRGELLEGEWGKELILKLSGRLPHEVMVLPVTCQGKVIALLYGDNGESQRPLSSPELLEILLIQAGIALENSILSERLLQLTRVPSPS